MNLTKFFTPRDIALHCTADDLWVSLLGKVLDLTQLVNGKNEDEIFPLLAFAGKDVSHFFDKDGEIRLYVDPNTNKIRHFFPFRSLIGSPSQEEAERLYWKRKEEEEETAATFIQIYMTDRLGDELMSPIISRITKSTSEGNKMHSKNVDSAPMVSPFSSEEHDSSDKPPSSSSAVRYERNEDFSRENRSHPTTPTASVEVKDMQNISSDDNSTASLSNGEQNNSDHSLPKSSQRNLNRKIISSREHQKYSIADHPTETSSEQNGDSSDSFSQISSSREKYTSGSTLSAYPTEIRENNVMSSDEKENHPDLNNITLSKEEIKSDSSDNFPLTVSSNDRQNLSVNGLQAHESEGNQENHANNPDKEQKHPNTILLDEKATHNGESSDNASDILSSTENQNLSDSVLPISSGIKQDGQKEYSSVEELKQLKTDGKNTCDDEYSDESLGVSSSIETKNVSNCSIPTSSAEKQEDNEDSSVVEHKQSTTSPASSSKRRNTFNNDASNDSSTMSPSSNDERHHSDILLPTSPAEHQEINGDISEKSSTEQKSELSDSSPTAPWWKDSRYIVGLVTRKARQVKILNSLIMREVSLEVCSEDTIEDIIERYLKFNSNAHNYAWKYHGQVLNMRQNLQENGIPDQDEIASSLRLNPEDYIPTLTLYFSDSIEYNGKIL